MYKFIQDYVAGDDNFCGYDLLELIDVNGNSPEDVLADFFLDMMGHYKGFMSSLACRHSSMEVIKDYDYSATNKREGMVFRCVKCFNVFDCTHQNKRFLDITKMSNCIEDYAYQNNFNYHDRFHLYEHGHRHENKYISEIFLDMMGYR